MEFSEVVATRFSVRKFDQRPLEPEVLERILEAARIAPTGCNKQPFKIYVLESAGALAKIRSLSRCAFDAPIVLLFALDIDREWRNPLEEGYAAGMQDVSIVATHVMLAAWNEGVGTCWVNYFAPSAVEAAFDLPANESAVLLMPIGYASDEAEPGPMHFPRKPLEELVATI